MRIIFKGPPIPLMRPRFARGRVYDAQKEIKDRLTWELKMQETWEIIPDGPIEIKLEFHMPIASSLSRKIREEYQGKWDVNKPDIDNLIKMPLDIMNGHVFTDDRQIVAIKAEKKYDLEPRTVVEIWRL